MAKKAELLAEAKKLKLDVTEKNTIAEIQAALESADSKQLTAESKDDEKAPVAKAGKRSAKALAEAEEKAAKDERKSSLKASADMPKPAVPKTRSKLERRSKAYRKSAELIDKDKTYSLGEAVALAAKTSHVKFDASVELHVNLNVDPKQADQNIRNTVVLPAGSGKSIRVAVFASDEAVKEAKKAGADIAGGDDFLQKLDEEKIDFDVLIAEPSVMAKLGKYARLLGPKGLMPNPKSGTVSQDVAKAVTEAKAGKVEYRVDSTGIIHVAVGKVSFGEAKLVQNTEAVLSSIKASKPSSVKGAFIHSIHVTTTMGPSVSISTSDI